MVAAVVTAAAAAVAVTVEGTLPALEEFAVGITQ